MSGPVVGSLRQPVWGYKGIRGIWSDLIPLLARAKWAWRASPLPLSLEQEEEGGWGWLGKREGGWGVGGCKQEAAASGQAGSSTRASDGWVRGRYRDFPSFRKRSSSKTAV